MLVVVREHWAQEQPGIQTYKQTIGLINERVFNSTVELTEQGYQLTQMNSYVARDLIHHCRLVFTKDEKEVFNETT